MKIGFVYDLRDDYRKLGWDEEQTAEFDTIDTIDAIANALTDLGHQLDRIGNLNALVARLAQGSRWDLVFNIAAGAHGFGREAQVPALLDAYQIPYTFSGPTLLALALDKSLTKRVIRDAGIPTAPFAVASTLHDLAQINLPWPRFVKPIAEGTSKGINQHSRATTQDEFVHSCTALLERFRQPVLVETFLPGREFTIGLLGHDEKTHILGILEVILRPHAEPWSHSFKNKVNAATDVEYRIVDDALAYQAAHIAKQAWQTLGCLDAGRIDIRVDEFGTPCFLEVNPLTGLKPGHSDLCIIAEKIGMSYQDLIANILYNCCNRLGLTV